MVGKSVGKGSYVVAGLAIAVVLLLSSTVYFAMMTNRSVSNGSAGASVSYNSLAPAGQSGTGDPVSGNATRVITVSGTGDVSFTPTEAIVDLSVVTQNSTAGEATAANAVATTSVIHALNSIGISNSSIKTTSYNLSPQYNYVQGEPPRILSYTVTNSLEVNITSSGASQLGVRAGQVIDTGVGAGANQVSLQFTASASLMKQLEDQALQRAVSDASTTAQTMAGALGVSITGVIMATTGSYYSPQPVYATNAAALAVSGPSTPIVPGTMTVTASVQVTYGIA